MSKYVTTPKTIIFLSTEGGVLKSIAADQLVGTARINGITTAFFDGDHKNEYGNYTKYTLKDEDGKVLPDDAFKGCEKFDVIKESIKIINSTDIPAKLRVYDIGANKLEDAFSGLNSAEKFFTSFDEEDELVIMVPVSNEKCVRTFEVLYNYVSNVNADKLERPVKVIAYINHGFMEVANEVSYKNTMESFQSSQFVQRIIKDKKRFSFKQVDLYTTFDTVGLVQGLFKSTNFEKVKTLVDERQVSKAERKLSSTRFHDATILINAVLDNPLVEAD